MTWNTAGFVYYIAAYGRHYRCQLSITIVVSIISTVFHVLTCLMIDNESSICFNGHVSVVYSLGMSILILFLFIANCHLLCNRTDFHFKVFCRMFLFLLLRFIMIVYRNWVLPLRFSFCPDHCCTHLVWAQVASLKRNIRRIIISSTRSHYFCCMVAQRDGKVHYH